MLHAVQRGLESLYRVETGLDVTDYVVDAPAQAGSREQLLAREDDAGTLSLALFVDPRALANLAANDPRRRLDDENLQDFLLVVEGVSHFVYLAWRAQAERPVSALELELQAEIDKYVTCALLLLPQGEPVVGPGGLRARLFERFQLAPGLSPGERERYLVANARAHTYAASLESRFLSREDILPMIAELRAFYRLSAQDKLARTRSS